MAEKKRLLSPKGFRLIAIGVILYLALDIFLENPEENSTEPKPQTNKDQSSKVVSEKAPKALPKNLPDESVSEKSTSTTKSVAEDPVNEPVTEEFENFVATEDNMADINELPKDNDLPEDIVEEPSGDQQEESFNNLDSLTETGEMNEDLKNDMPEPVEDQELKILKKIEDTLKNERSSTNEAISDSSSPQKVPRIDYQNFGSALLYNCRERHWACLASIEYQKCSDDYKREKDQGMPSGCIPEQEYLDELSCHNAQQLKTDNSLNKDCE